MRSTSDVRWKKVQSAIGKWQLASGSNCHEVMSKLSHVDETGRVRMVDTSDKELTTRRAVASATVVMAAETVTALREHRSPKGDPLEAARLAGIMAAKKTAELIPLCHPLPLTHIDVYAELTNTAFLFKQMLRPMRKLEWRWRH